ncbi:GNAT family N-acetyltransferase [Phytoactinopolyspora mesophila]|uniref:GNAT family N-acetyltransferase n=1 Tax=Phytoactinopolyspora mesophila TaxID=2650750 RepID=A0A7K3LXQ3_9ACTN|nr:GNAT family N-acetyltransferase [Phytoactinopolyspora mesophila]NDL55814.1 GNAT family N-acetyltransferase [Phytoactinopolyspora mesophila]
MSNTIAETETVRKATAADAGRLAETLAAAFFTDPVLSWCYPDLARRASILPASFRVIVDAAMPHGGVDTVADEVAGAVWIPFEADVDDDAMAAELGRLSAEYAERSFTLFELMGAHHPHEPHDYLFVFGTQPEWQSRGLGSALLRSALASCDRHGMPAYLEATSERNMQLYRRHGFDVTEVVTLPDGPPLWCMWRRPSSITG